MITDKRGEAAVAEIERWARAIIHPLDVQIGLTVYDDAETNTYVLRLARGGRVLLFRLSEAQVQSAQRERECEKILKTKIKDL